MIGINDMIRTNCRFCDETYDMGAVIHTCRKNYKSFRDFGVCPCTEDCKDFDGRSDYQRGYDDAMKDKKEMKVYVVDDTYDIYYEGSTTKIVGVFSTKRQAMYAMYNASNELIRDYRSHNGLKFRHGWVYRPCTAFEFTPNYIFAEVDDSESYAFSISEVKLDEVIK